MLGLQTLVRGEDLLLTGANFALRGFPDDSISWFLSSENKVRGTIHRHVMEELRHSTLSDLLYVATARFQRLILDLPAQTAHAFANSNS
jgi:hypothetical protein